MNPIYLTTQELAAAIRARQVSAQEALEAHLAQIAAHNPELNAVVTMNAERAFQRACQADDALDRGETWGPLHGVPFTLKDAHATACLRTTTGFPPLADFVPQEDSAVTARIKAAGAILIGKTNVPALLADYQTNNPIFGRTNNPWDVDRTAGGSSGGAAAALAAGMTPFEIGTDLSASIRIPAAFCGVYGLKPTERRVPLTGLIPGLPSPRSVRIMSCIGPMARSVADLDLLYRIIAGPGGGDPEVPPAPLEPLTDVDLRDLRVAFAPTFPGFPAAAEIRSAVEGLAAQISPLCAAVEEAGLPDLDYFGDLAAAGQLIGMITGVFDPSNQENPVSLAQYMQALDRRDRSIAAWEAFFEDWDVLLCPATMVTAFPHCPPGAPLQVDGQEVDYWMVSAHGTLFNYTGAPAVALPAGLDRAGLPIGLQLVGPRWGEARLLAAAQAISAVTGPFRRPPCMEDEEKRNHG